MYLDDAKRLCVLVEAYAISTGVSHKENARQELMQFSERLVRKLIANRITHPSLNVPECVRLLANSMSPELAQWNMASRMAPVAKGFLTDSVKNDEMLRGRGRSSVRPVSSEPPPAA